MNEYEHKLKHMQDAKQAIRLYQQKQIGKDDALLTYKVWIDPKGIFNPIYFMSAHTAIRFVNHLTPQFIDDQPEFLQNNIGFFINISVDQIQNQTVRMAIDDHVQAYNDQYYLEEYYAELHANIDDNERERPYNAFDDLPIEDTYNFFDGDPRDMEDHFGSDWESNL